MPVNIEQEVLDKVRMTLKGNITVKKIADEAGVHPVAARDMLHGRRKMNLFFWEKCLDHFEYIREIENRTNAI